MPLLASRLGRAAAGLGQGQTPSTLPERAQKAVQSPMLESQRGRHLQARRQMVIGRQRRLQRVMRRAAQLPQMAWDCPRLLAH